MNDPIAEAELPEPANLKFLRRLVTTLTAVMIGGLLILIALIVIRLQQPMQTVLPLPDQITLPDGTTATAFTKGGDWYAVVTAEDEILIFDRATGELSQTVKIEK